MLFDCLPHTVKTFYLILIALGFLLVFLNHELDEFTEDPCILHMGISPHTMFRICVTSAIGSLAPSNVGKSGCCFNLLLISEVH